MPSFRDAVQAYKSNQSGAVQVNPPEAVAVLQTQSTPEVEAPKVAPAPSVVPAAVTATPAASALVIAPLPSTPAVEGSRRKRRTKAEMEAARVASGVSSPMTGAAATAPADEDEPELTWRDHVRELEALGFEVHVQYHTRLD